MQGCLNKKTICKTCGTQFPGGKTLPDICPICNDDRQYIGDTGQQWTDMEELNNHYAVKIEKINEQLYELKMIPAFAIGQRALLLLAPSGNILWDCIPQLNEATIAFIQSKGGLKAIAFSHPHFFSTMNVWSKTFNCPVFINHLDEEWVVNKSEQIELWKGDSKLLWDNISIINIGGHFPGSCILHIPFLSKKGTVLCGDSLYISRSKNHIAIMHSYPNQIILSKKEFISVYNKTSELEFDSLFGAFAWENINGNAKEIFTKSMMRYKESYEINV